MAQPPITTHRRASAFKAWLDNYQSVLELILGSIFLALITVLIAGFWSNSTSNQHRAQSATQKGDAYKTAAGQLAATNDANCKAAGKKCVGNSKQVVKSLPTAVQSVVSPVASGIPGKNGTNGRNGRGIVLTDVSGTGHLLVTYTDGSTQDVGVVVGKNGKDGKNGRGIASTSVSNGDLLVAYSDGTSKNLGQVVGQNGLNGTDGTNGKDGRGIASTAIVSGHLIVAYTDGTADDVGPVVGKDGTNGTSVTDTVVDSNGDLQVTLTAADGSTKVIDAGHVVGQDGQNGRNGQDGANGQPPVSWTEHAPDGSVTQICQRSSDFDADNPTYQCSPPAQSSSNPTETPS